MSGDTGDRRRWGALVVGLLVTVLFCWLTFSKVDLADVVERSAGAALGVMALSLLPKGMGFVFMSLRSQQLLRPVGSYTFGQVVRSVFVGFSGNSVLPFRIGEILRIGYLARMGGADPAACLSVVVLERLLDMATLTALFALVVPLAVVEVEVGTLLPLVMGLIAVMLGAGVVVARQPQPVLRLAARLLEPLPGAVSRTLLGLIEGLVSGLAGLASTKSVLIALSSTLAYWLCGVASASVWFAAFSLELPWFAPFVLLFSVALGSLLPSSPGAVGTWHYFAVAALVGMDVSRTTATSVAILGHALAFVPYTVLALPILLPDLLAWWRGRRR